ncbi:PREDICTED: photosystem I reaction center subunit II-2, chloroplastic-like [Populus euphratica]|uniref:Photosystem I reaction center subunit II-2, chloroplastic-like n=1 Tax=Populus euphratica TaxID=75702 RepID=A0AAJ6UJR7_POPEU|nr:PREDICTED: photosystem I reaction center subunit II-2, chloroplastic-like [Populus euphratica]
MVNGGGVHKAPGLDHNQVSSLHHRHPKIQQASSGSMETSLVILIHSHASQLFHDSRSLRVSVAEEKTEVPKKEAPVCFSAGPKHSLITNLWWYSGELLRKAPFEEFYVITLDSPKEQIF